MCFIEYVDVFHLDNMLSLLSLCATKEEYQR